MSENVLRGVVHGNVIELEENSGMSDGQAVEIVVRRVSHRPTGEGLRRTAGALAHDEEWDGIMEEVQRGRREDRREQVDEEAKRLEVLRRAAKHAANHEP